LLEIDRNTPPESEFQIVGADTQKEREPNRTWNLKFRCGRA